MKNPNGAVKYTRKSKVGSKTQDLGRKPKKWQHCLHRLHNNTIYPLLFVSVSEETIVIVFRILLILSNTQSRCLFYHLDRDTDGDGIPDQFDPDDDGDGIPDVDDVDDDGDNIPDRFDPDQVDTDRDGIPDSADPDDDNDGILDRDDPDDDGNGIPDLFEARLRHFDRTLDSDRDGIPDYLDDDDDNDGIPDFKGRFFYRSSV